MAALVVLVALTVSDWFHSLSRIEDGVRISCCDVADCKRTEYRIRGDGYLVPNPETGEWTPVPPEVVIVRSDNPTGSAIACWFAGKLRCFVPGTES